MLVWNTGHPEDIFSEDRPDISIEVMIARIYPGGNIQYDIAVYDFELGIWVSSVYDDETFMPDYWAEFNGPTLPSEEKNLRGYENPETIMICPEEGWAYLPNGQPYHKLLLGCGWIGPSKECKKIVANSFIRYECPKCGYDVENRDTLMGQLEDPSLIPWGPAFLYRSGRQYFLDHFKDGDRYYYRK